MKWCVLCLLYVWTLFLLTVYTITSPWKVDWIEENKCGDKYKALHSFSLYIFFIIIICVVSNIWILCEKRLLLSIFNYINYSQLLNIIILKFKSPVLLNQYFPIKVQLYWECTGTYISSRAEGIFHSTLPVELAVYWKI